MDIRKGAFTWRVPVGYVELRVCARMTVLIDFSAFWCLKRHVYACLFSLRKEK